MQFTRRLKKIIAHQNQTTNPALQEFQHLLQILILSRFFFFNLQMQKHSYFQGSDLQSSKFSLRPTKPGSTWAANYSFPEKQNQTRYT